MGAFSFLCLCNVTIEMIWLWELYESGSVELQNCILGLTPMLDWLSHHVTSDMFAWGLYVIVALQWTVSKKDVHFWIILIWNNWNVKTYTFLLLKDWEAGVRIYLMNLTILALFTINKYAAVNTDDPMQTGFQGFIPLVGFFVWQRNTLEDIGGLH